MLIGLASPSMASAVDLEQRPFMGGLDGDRVAVAVNLDGPAEPGRVEIDGRRAEVRRIGLASDGVYQAIVDRGRMKSGGMYRVELRFCDGDDCVEFDESVYLRQRYSG